MGSRLDANSQTERTRRPAPFALPAARDNSLPVRCRHAGSWLSAKSPVERADDLANLGPLAIKDVLTDPPRLNQAVNASSKLL